MILADIDESLAVLLRVLCLRFIGHERVDDLSSLSTGERVVRADIAIVIAGNVRIMVRVLQTDAECRVNGHDIKIRQLANGELRGGLILHAGGRLRPGSGQAVSVETILLGEDRDTIGGGGSRNDLVLVLVVEDDLSTGCEGAPRGLHDDQIVGQLSKGIADDASGFRRDFLGRSRDSLFRCDIFIGCKSHDRQHAENHDRSEKHAEQFAGLFH